MVTTNRLIGIGEFRQRATEIIKEVEISAEPVTISRHGRPVVEIRPLRETRRDLRGSATFAVGVDITEPVTSESDWDAGI